MSYVHSIFRLKDAPKDGKCWRLLICKEELRPDSTAPYAKTIFKGDYTAKIGAERAHKRQMKKLTRLEEANV